MSADPVSLVIGIAGIVATVAAVITANRDHRGWSLVLWVVATTLVAVVSFWALQDLQNDQRVSLDRLIVIALIGLGALGSGIYLFVLWMKDLLPWTVRIQRKQMPTTVAVAKLPFKVAPEGDPEVVQRRSAVYAIIVNYNEFLLPWGDQGEAFRGLCFATSRIWEEKTWYPEARGKEQPLSRAIGIIQALRHNKGNEKAINLQELQTAVRLIAGLEDLEWALIPSPPTVAAPSSIEPLANSESVERLREVFEFCRKAMEYAYEIHIADVSLHLSTRDNSSGYAASLVNEYVLPSYARERQTVIDYLEQTQLTVRDFGNLKLAIIAILKRYHEVVSWFLKLGPSLHDEFFSWHVYIELHRRHRRALEELKNIQTRRDFGDIAGEALLRSLKNLMPSPESTETEGVHGGVKDPIEIIVEITEGSYIALLPSEESNTLLAASLEKVRIRNRDVNPTRIDRMWLDIDGAVVLEGASENEEPKVHGKTKIEGRDAEDYTFEVDKVYRGVIKNEEAVARVKLYVDAIGLGIFSTPLPKGLFTLKE